jgi:hypothetical protein
LGLDYDGFTYKDPEIIQNIAQNDGFESWQEMKQFFPKDFFGKLITWRECEWVSDSAELIQL